MGFAAGAVFCAPEDSAAPGVLRSECGPVVLVDSPEYPAWLDLFSSIQSLPSGLYLYHLSPRLAPRANFAFVRQRVTLPQGTAFDACPEFLLEAWFSVEGGAEEVDHESDGGLGGASAGIAVGVHFHNVQAHDFSFGGDAAHQIVNFREVQSARF